MYDFGVPETAELHGEAAKAYEQQVAAHVESLVNLGWRWEGRGLVPTLNPFTVSTVVSSATDNHSRVSDETLQRFHQK